MKTSKSPIKLFALVALLASSVVSAQGINMNWQESYNQEASGNYAKAAVAIDLVLQTTPTNEFALLRHGWLNYMQARYNDALRDYDQALKLNPKSHEALLGRTLPLMAQQRWREAAVEANKVIASSRWDYTAHVRLMICEEAEKKWEALARHATELAERYPSDATIWVYLARSEAWQGHIDLAKAAYAKVLERMPAHIEALAYIDKYN